MSCSLAAAVKVATESGEELDSQECRNIYNEALMSSSPANLEMQIITPNADNNAIVGVDISSDNFPLPQNNRCGDQPSIDVHVDISDQPQIGKRKGQSNVKSVSCGSEPLDQDGLLATRVLPKPKIKMIQASQNPRSGSDRSLSTTQEIDPEFYKSFNHGIADEYAGMTSQPPVETTQDDRDERHSTNGQTEKSLLENDTGHIEIHFVPTSPMQYSTEPSDTYSAIATRHQQEHVSQLDPVTPAPQKAAFAQMMAPQLMNPSQLFDATQPSPAIGYTPGTNLPSSARPSPNVWNIEGVAKHDISSPLATHNGRLTSATAKDTYSSDADEETHENEPAKGFQTKSSHSTKHTETVQRRNTEPRDQYVSVHSSQIRKLPAMSFSQVSGVSDDADFHDEDFAMKNRAAAKRREAMRSLNRSSAALHATNSDDDEIEVPSTAKVRREKTLQEQYIAQCSGHDSRDSQDGKVILDSQGQNQTSTSGSETHNTIGSISGSNAKPFHRTTDSSSLETVDDEPRNEHVENVLGEEVTGKDVQSQIDLSSSPPAESEASTERLPSQPARGSVQQYEFKTPVLQRSLNPERSDDIIPETSPTAPHTKTFAQMDEEYQTVGGDQEPPPRLQLTQDDIDLELFSRSPSLSMPGMGAPRILGIPETDFLLKRPGGSRMSSQVLRITTTTTPSISQRVVTPSSTSSSLTPYGSTPTDPNLSSQTATSELSDDVVDMRGCRDSIAGTQDIGNREISPANDEPPMPSQRTLRAANQMKGPSSDLRRFHDGADIPSDTSVTADTSAELLEVSLPRKKPTPSQRKSSGRFARRSKRTRNISSTSTETQAEILVKSPDPIALIASPSTTSVLAKSVSSRALRALCKIDNGDIEGSLAPTSSGKFATRHSKRVAESDRPRSVDLSHSTTPSKARRSSEKGFLRNTEGLFGNMIFCVSYGDRMEEKDQVTKIIDQQGGILLDGGFQELFEDVAPAILTPSSTRRGKSRGVEMQLSLKPSTLHLGFACLIADEHSRKAKYMQALALGLPCISGVWILHCVAQGRLLSWDAYVLAAGKSNILGGAIKSRVMTIYPAESAKLVDTIESRQRLLQGKRILLVATKGKGEESRKPYQFLTQASGASCVKRVSSNDEARKAVQGARGTSEEWDWVYLDTEKSVERRKEAEKAILGSVDRKRKHQSAAIGAMNSDSVDGRDMKRVRLVSDEFIIQSLILGSLVEVDEV